MLLILMASRERHAQMKAPRLHNELLQVERGTRPKAKVVTLRDSRKINQHWLYQRTVLKGGRRLRAHYKGKQWLEWEYIALRHSRSPASGLKVALQYGRVCVCSWVFKNSSTQVCRLHPGSKAIL